MEITIKLDLTEEEARARIAEFDQLLEKMRQGNECVARRQEEVKRLQEETDAVIGSFKERSRVGTTN